MLSTRRINTGEADVYRAVRLRALSDAPAAFCTTHAEALTRSPETWHEQADTAARGPNRAIFFALFHDEAVGLAALYRHPEQDSVGELLQVWVAPDHRGSGTAKALLDALFRWGGLEAGFTSVIAEVKANNARALGFYEKAGFKHVTDTQASDPNEIILRRAPVWG